MAPTVAWDPLPMVPEGIRVRAWKGHPKEERSHQAVVVVGHPYLYPRFGFRRGGECRMRCNFDIPGDAFLVTEGGAREP